MCGAHPGDADCMDETTDQDVLDAAEAITELYERLQRLQEPEPRKHVQTSGGVCRSCGGWTTYTRQNSVKGLCMKCEGDQK
jgi:hypothetical protein